MKREGGFLACCPDWSSDDFVQGDIFESITGKMRLILWCPHCERQHMITVNDETPVQEAVREILENEVVQDFLTGTQMDAFENLSREVSELRRIRDNQAIRIGELESRIEEMAEKARTMAQDAANQLQEAIRHATNTGTHRDRSEAQLMAIRRISYTIQELQFNAEKIAHVGGYGGATRDMDDIPF